MSLITCPERSKQISDKASVCPDCAYPFNTVEVKAEEPLPKSPDFPSDLSVGKPVTDRSGDRNAKMNYNRNDNVGALLNITPFVNRIKNFARKKGWGMASM